MAQHSDLLRLPGRTRIFCQPNDRTTGLHQPASAGKPGRIVVRGTAFQPEPIYYIFSFGAMVCGWQILQRRSWWWYPVFGVQAGFSYLSKPSFEPFLVVFAASLGLRLILDRDLAAVPAAAAGCLAAILLMGAMITPLFLYKKEHFGAANFGYPKYWMWMDD